MRGEKRANVVLIIGPEFGKFAGYPIAVTYNLITDSR